MPQARILIVEDEYLIATALEMELDAMGYAVCGIAASAAEAIRLARREQPDVVLMDMRLKGKRDGVDAARAIFAEGLAAKIIFVTGSREQQTIDRIQTDHPAGILIKPVGPDQIDATIRRVV